MTAQKQPMKIVTWLILAFRTLISTSDKDLRGHLVILEVSLPFGVLDQCGQCCIHMSRSALC